MSANLEKALDELVLYDADYSEVNRLIAQYNNMNLDPTQIDVETTKRVDDAIASVETGLKIDKQDQVDYYAYLIDAAIKGIKYKPADYTLVTIAVTNAETELAKTTYWSAESLANLRAVVDSVEYGYGVDRQEEVNVMAQRVTQAIKELLPGPADYSRVNAAIERFNALDHSHYTPASVAAVQDVINSIDWDLTRVEQDIVNGYAFDIQTAQLDLVEAKADYSELDRIIEKEVPQNLSDYTTETVKDLTNVLNSIDRSLKAKDQAKVIGYQNSLREAIANLAYKPGDYTDVYAAIAEGREIIANSAVDKKDAEAFEAYIAEIDYTYTIKQQTEIANIATQLRAMYAKFSAAESVHNASITLEADRKVTYTGAVITVSVIVGTDYYAAATSIPVLYDSNFFELVGANVGEAFKFEGSFAASSQVGGNINSPSKGYPSSYTASDKNQWKYALITVTPDPEINETAQVLDPAQTVVKLQFRVKNIVGVNGKIWIDDAFLKTDDNKSGKLYIGRYKTSEVNNDVVTVGQSIDLTNASITVNVLDANSPADFTELMKAYNTILDPAGKKYYETESYAAYEDALIAAEELIMNKSQYTVKEQAIVDDAANVLNEAIKNLKLLPVNKTPLEEALALVPEHSSDKYTTDTYLLYLSAVEAGNAILAEENLTVVDNERIKAAADEIISAFEDLTLKSFSYKNQMELALSTGPDYEEEVYTEESYQAYMDAYIALEEFSTKEPTILDDDEGLTLITRVNSTRRNLKLKPADTAELEAEIAEYYTKNPNHYTTSTFRNYKNAVEDGIEILERTDLTALDNGEIQDVLAEIIKYKGRLRVGAFTKETEVNEALDLGFAYLELEPEYTPESFEIMLNALIALIEFNDTVEDKNATHDDVAMELIQDLYDAIDELKYIPADLTLLEEALALETLDEEYYTEESYQAYKDALAALEAYGEDYYWGLDEQEIVDALAADIIMAHGELKFKPFTKLADLEAALEVTPEYPSNYYIDTAYAEYEAARAAIEDMIADADNLTLFDDDAALELIADYNATLVALKSAWADAEYADVYAAIEEANALNRNIYKNFEIVDEAINNVVYGLNIFAQETVDGYAAAIREAIGNLEYSGADYTVVENAKTAAAEKLAEMQATGIEVKQSTVDALNKAIDNVVAGLDVTKQDEVNAFADAIVAATEALDYVSTIVLKAESVAYITDEGYIRGLAGVTADGIVSQFDVYGKATTIVVTPTANGCGTGTLVQHFDGEELVAEYVIVVDGDADGDCFVTALDVTYVTFLINEFEEPESEYVMTAIDLENDGWLDAIDLTIIINMANAEF